MTGLGVYVSPAEFIVLLELAGEGPCSILFGREEPDDDALAQAFVALFRRDLIQRQGEGFTVSGAGEAFGHMRRAPIAVLVSGPRRENVAICYVGRDGMWLVEPADVILQKQYRVQRMCWEGVKSWFFDTGLLSPSTLREEDAPELNAMLAENSEPHPGDVLLLLEKRENGGGLLETFEICRWCGTRLIIHWDGEGTHTVLYTAQSVEHMLAECFGREE